MALARRLAAVAPLLTLALAGAVWYRTAPAPRPLSRVAARVLGPRELSALRQAPDPGSSFRAPDAIFGAVRVSDLSAVTIAMAPTEDGRYIPQAFRIQWAARTKTPLATVNAALRAWARDGVPDPFWPNWSPDGRWLVWPDARADNLMLVSVDDGTSRRCRAPFSLDGMAIHWLPDSSGWVALARPEGDAVAYHYMTDRPEPIRHTPLAGLSGVWRSIGVTSYGILLLAIPRIGADGTPGVRVVQYDLGTGHPQPRPLGALSFPGMALQEAACSPRGDRIAWLFAPREGIRRPGLAARIRLRLLPASGTVSMSGLWLSAPDGSRLRRLADVEPGDLPRQLAWERDGRRLRFAYQQALYALTVE
ncbi:MAG: hypothetical protein IT208_05305 [Chthonomonadales bacterium]|nr:hypothetical protein [Chthonomonadales bacterium]